MTNNHVVAGGGEVVVRLHDGREFKAEEYWTDPLTDIAVVKINATHAEVNCPQQLQLLAESVEFGTAQPMTVLRDGRRIQLKFTPQERPDRFGFIPQ